MEISRTVTKVESVGDARHVIVEETTTIHLYPTSFNMYEGHGQMVLTLSHDEARSVYFAIQKALGLEGLSVRANGDADGGEVKRA